jgi:hypothetical protein
MHSILCSNRNNSSTTTATATTSVDTNNRSNSTAQDDHSDGGHVILRDPYVCTDDSTGNMLGYIFLVALYTFSDHRTMTLDCPMMLPPTSRNLTVATLLSTLQQPQHLLQQPQQPKNPTVWYYDPRRTQTRNTTTITTTTSYRRGTTLTTTTTTTNTSRILPDIDFCTSLQKNKYPHQYRYGLQYLAPFIRTVLQEAFRTTTIATASEVKNTDDAVITSPYTEMDDVVIHIRCGNVLKYSHHMEYGYPRYEFYRQTIQEFVDTELYHSHQNHTTSSNHHHHYRFHHDTTFSIAIVTAPWDPSKCRPDKDCDMIDNICRPILLDLQWYLKTQFSYATVQIRHDDTTIDSYARMIQAKLIICNPSTFCIYPAIAAHGQSYIVASKRLYPFIAELPLIYDNIHVAEVEFLNMAQINEFRIQGKDLVTAITQWARVGSSTTTTVSSSSSPSRMNSHSNDNILDPSWTYKPSRIELIHDDFIVLNHVCLTDHNEQPPPPPPDHPYSLNFFDIDMNEEDLVRLFDDKVVPYMAWESDLSIGRPLIGIPKPVRIHSTLRQFLLNHQYETILEYQIRDGTTILIEPHHPDNNFHLHNDFILPALYKILKSGTKDLPKEHKRTLLLTHGSKERYQRRAIAFDALLRLFDEVQYSMEQILHGQNGGGVMCFERLIMGGRSDLPYYSHKGRFGTDNLWEGVIPTIRDWVNTAHGIHVGQASQLSNENLGGTPTKPVLTFVKRNCGGSPARCLKKNEDVVRFLSNRFDAKMLMFPKANNRTDQLMNMLQQMANTDILVGMHGAGLTHAMYLQPGTLLVEIKDGTKREKKLFLNMASMQDIGYYLYDALPASNRWETKLSNEEMENFTEDLWRAWEQEQEYERVRRNTSDPMSNGECLFPQFLDANRSRLSSFRFSRCYLEQAEAHSKEWWQCAEYGGCNISL